MFMWTIYGWSKITKVEIEPGWVTITTGILGYSMIPVDEPVEELPDELAERLSDLQDSDDGQEAYRLLEGVPRWGYGFESTESTDCDEPNLNITIDGM